MDERMEWDNTCKAPVTELGTHSGSVKCEHHYFRGVNVIIEHMNGDLQSYWEEFQEGEKDQQNQNFWDI